MKDKDIKLWIDLILFIGFFVLLYAMSKAA